MENGTQKNTLSKKERICCKKDIETLLAKGSHLRQGVLRCLVFKNEEQPFSRILVSVPKKNFKRAVKRNLLKRRIRECFRKQKHTLSGNYDLMFIYTSKQLSSYEELYKMTSDIMKEIDSRSESHDTK